jgi:error-prone DNA polymerase
VFGADGFYVELQRNQVHGDKALTQALADLADQTGLPVVATGDVHYDRQERYRLHDVLTAIRHRLTLDGSHAVRRANSEFYLRPPEAVERLFADRADAIVHSLAIAQRCAAFDLTRDLGYRFPDFHGSERAPAPRALAELCRARLEERYPAGHEHREEALARLDKELRLIELHGLSAFSSSITICSSWRATWPPLCAAAPAAPAATCCPAAAAARPSPPSCATCSACRTSIRWPRISSSAAS